MARRGRVHQLQVLPTYTEEDLLKETGRLLNSEHGAKQLVARITTDWEIEPARYQKTLADSAEAVKKYTRWAVTGPVLDQMVPRQGGAGHENTWKAAKKAIFGVEDHEQAAPPPTVSAAPGVLGAGGEPAAPAAPVVPHAGMWMAVCSAGGARVRAEVGTDSQEVAQLEEGQAIEVLEARQTAAGQHRVRFESEPGADGPSGWVSPTSKEGQAILRPIEGPLRPRPGAVCYVKAEKATVREGFALDSAEAGYLESNEVFIVVESRINDKGQVRVAFAADGLDHLGWVSMVTITGEVLLEIMPAGWEDDAVFMQADADGDGNVDAEEAARFEAFQAADTDGDGQVTGAGDSPLAAHRPATLADPRPPFAVAEMRAYARQRQATTDQVQDSGHRDGDDIYD